MLFRISEPQSQKPTTEPQEDRFNVEIYCYATGQTEAVIGENLSERQAEKRETTGLMRCNSDYGVRTRNLKTGNVQ